MVPWRASPDDTSSSYMRSGETGTCDTSSDLNVSFAVTVSDSSRDVLKDMEEDEKAARQEMLDRRERKAWRSRSRKHDFKQSKWGWNKPKCR